MSLLKLSTSKEDIVMKHSKINSVDVNDDANEPSVKIDFYGYGYNGSVNFSLNSDRSKIILDIGSEVEQHEISIKNVDSKAVKVNKQESDTKVDVSIGDYLLSVEVQYEAVYIVTTERGKETDRYKIEWEVLEPAGLP